MKYRENRIDVLRGLAIFCVVINHAGMRLHTPKMPWPSIPTPSRFGYSSAAELFVMLSGYMVGFIYLNRPNPLRKITARTWKIYQYNLITFVLALPILLSISGGSMFATNVSYLHEAPVQATLAFFTLIYAPFLLDVMRLYIAVMFLVLPLIAVSRKSELLALALSAGVYILTMAFYISGAEPLLAQRFSWFANPFCWQFVFFIMVSLGKRGFHRRFFNRLDEMKPIEHITIWAVVAVLAYAEQHAWHKHLISGDALISKEGLGPLRLAHAMLMLIFYGSIIGIFRSVLDREPFTSLAALGKNSLNCFLLSAWLTYLMIYLSPSNGSNYLDYLVGTTFILIVLVAYARWKEGRQVVPLQQSPGLTQ